MISLAITTYHRCYDDIVNSFIAAVDEPGIINEIIIVDDHSPMHVYADICSGIRNSGAAKKVNIQLHRNDINLGMAANKIKAIKLCKNDHVIIFDSDNTITKEYIHACTDYAHKENSTIYCPGFARPHFDYRHFDEITYLNVASLVNQPKFDCLINTCNYMVPRHEFTKICYPEARIDAADSAMFFYQWLKAGNKFKVIHEMQYEHKVHDGSGFLSNVHKNMDDVRKIIEKIKNL